jgi:hypothetical protein
VDCLLIRCVPRSYDNDDPPPPAHDAPPAAEPELAREEPQLEAPSAEPVRDEQTSYDAPDDSHMNDSSGAYQANGNGGMNGYGNDQNDMMGGVDDDSYGAIGMKEDG